MAEPTQDILLVGKTSFLARHALNALPAGRVRAISHGEIDRQGLWDGIKTVISFAKHPASMTADYDVEGQDPDLALARQIADRPIAYVMLSSRKVYAPATEPLTETSPIGPVDAYGKNKRAVEERLSALLGSRLTILRLANIFGDEREPGRKTFLAMVLNRLAETGQIRFDMSPFVERDFLPVDCLASLLARIVEKTPGGTLNLGSGIPLATGRLALWIMEGFGGGELLIASHEEKDRFVLDVGRMTARVGPACTMADLEDRCLALGRNLKRSLAR